MIWGREKEITSPSARTISSTHAKEDQSRKTPTTTVQSQIVMLDPRRPALKRPIATLDNDQSVIPHRLHFSERH